MKYLYYCSFFLMLCICGSSCAPYKAKQQVAAIDLPNLGSVVQLKKNVLYTRANQIGQASLERPLHVRIKEMPFNKTSYKAYTYYTGQAHKANTIAYVDSLPVKPTYLQLELQDRIALTDLLNTERNDGVRSYLENDPHYKIVTSIAVVASESMSLQFLSAEELRLTQNDLGELFLELHQGKTKKQIAFGELQIFNYEHASFCWGEDQFNNRKIKAIVDGKGCPKGTYKKPSKMNSKRSYLKF